MNDYSLIERQIISINKYLYTVYIYERPFDFIFFSPLVIIYKNPK